MGPQKDGSNGSQGDKPIENSAGTGEGTLQVGDKTYTPEDVAMLVNGQATATQAMQEVADIKAAAEKYGIDPKTFVEQAEGSFSVMSTLIDQGVIDSKGAILETKPGPDTSLKPETDDSLEGLFGVPKPTQPTGNDKTMSVIQDALQKIPELVEQNKKLTEQLESLDQTQSNIIRTNIQEKIQDKFKNLDTEDVSRVFALAMQDRSKDVYVHAEAFSKVKSARTDELRKQHAEEFGIDLDKYNENKLLESEPGYGAAVQVKGKKLSFKKKDGAVTPKQATVDFLNRQMQKI